MQTLNDNSLLHCPNLPHLSIVRVQASILIARAFPLFAARVRLDTADQSSARKQERSEVHVSLNRDYEFCRSSMPRIFSVPLRALRLPMLGDLTLDLAKRRIRPAFAQGSHNAASLSSCSTIGFQVGTASNSYKAGRTC